MSDTDNEHDRRVQNLEQRLDATTAALQRAERDLDELGRTIAHDLRAPLRAIRTFGHLLATEKREELGDEAKQYLDFVTSGAERMSFYIDGLVAFIRLESRGDAPEAVELEAVLAEVELGLHGTVVERNAEVSREGSFGSVYGVRAQLLQLFHHLLHNGLKFDEGQPRVTFRGSIHGDVVEVEVSDRGIGLPRGASARIFGLFDRAVSRDEFPGMGVGLAICKKIVELHHGSIEAHEGPGPGARFTVRLPASPPNLTLPV